MKRARYFAHSCEQALARGDQLHAALSAALSAVGGPLPREAAALGATMGPGVEKALRQLGFEPLAARAAVLAPERAAEAGRRLRALPDARALAKRALRSWRYVGAVLAFQILVAALLRAFVLPTFEKMMSATIFELPFAARAAWTLLRPLGSPVLTVALVALALFSGRLLEVPARKLLWEATGARVCAAASALVAGGMEGSRALGALLEAAPEVRARLEAFLRDGALSGDALRRGSEALAVRARARAARLRRVSWSAGMALAILFGACILTSAYGAIFSIGSMPFRWPQ